MYESLMKIALFGEDEHVAERRMADWSDYLYELRSDQGEFSAFRATLFATLSHIAWRFRASDERTTVRVALFLATASVTSLLIPFMVLPDPVPIFRGQDVHLALGALALAVVLLRYPRVLPHCRYFGAALALTGTGLIQVGLTINPGEFGSAALDLAFVASGALMLVPALMLIAQKVPSGFEHVPIVVFSGSIVLTSVAYIPEILNPSVNGTTPWAVLGSVLGLAIAKSFWSLRLLPQRDLAVA